MKSLARAEVPELLWRLRQRVRWPRYLRVARLLFKKYYRSRYLLAWLSAVLEADLVQQQGPHSRPLRREEWGGQAGGSHPVDGWFRRNV